MNAPSDAKPVPSDRGHRAWWVAKWVGLVACVLIVALFSATFRWRFGWSRPVGSEWCTVLIWGGSLVFGAEPRTPDLDRGRHPIWGVSPKDRGLNWSLYWENLPPGFVDVMVPLWIPLLVLAFPTAALWWLDRRSARWRRAGLCARCGYDLRGLPATGGGARCPECGRGLEADAVPAPQRRVSPLV